MEVIELIGKIILGLIFLLLLKILWRFYITWFSKVTKSNIIYHNKVVASPNDFNIIKDNLSVIKKSFIEKVNSTTKILKTQKNNNYSIAEKLKLLKELDELKDKMVVTDKEYESFKKEILN